MCGIVGIAGPGAGRLTEPLRAMRTALGHRGPDAQGEKLYPDCALGHTRLSIIDLAGGGQPLAYGDGSTCVVFNGEIYGYRELRKRITAPLFTASDTELIPALYAEHGCDLCRYLPGMFAFALWDEPNRRLFCGRDRFGEKPLYWSLTPEGLFVFASELPALLASGLVRPRLNLRAVSAYLALRYVPEGMTIYEDVHLLQPGHALVFEDRRVRSFAYWTAPAPMAVPPSPDEAREEFARLMTQAVRRCSVADVEVAVLLSGGLDSTTIAALASQEAQLHAFSFGFEGGRNELPYARAAAAHYGLPLTELVEGELDLPTMLLAMPKVYGEPFADPSTVPTCALCRHVAEHVKVALGGDGGDELLAGYSWYKPLLDVAPGGASNGWSPVAERHWRLNTYFKPEQIAELGLPEVVRPRLAAPTGTLDDALRLDIDRLFLPSDILRKVDRAAMFSGLELRSPFLDRDLAEFLIALPWTYKMTPGRDKILLRDTFSGLWPESIRTRGKQGFGADVSAWQQRPGVRTLREHYLFGRNRRIRELFPRSVYERFAADTANHGWLLLVLSIWLESAPCELPSRDVESQPSSPQRAGSSRPHDNEVIMINHNTASSLAFRDALLLRLISAETDAHDDNSQRFYQLGDEATRTQDRVALAAEPVVDVDAVLRVASVRAVFDEELDTKATLYRMLADDASRKILVDLAAYRILGHRRVKLGYHGLDNVRLREDLLRRCMRPEQADPHLVADISPKWATDLFSLFDLSPVGRNLRIYSIGEEIYRFMHAPSYHCTSGGVVRPEAGDVVLDCGAAFGDVSLQFALSVGESGRVVCFEPYPLFLRVFRENMKLNPALAGRIEVVERATWDRDGETLSFIAGGGGSRIDEGGRAELKIATTTIDAVVRERNLPRVDFIKMDIEGAELKALRGAEATLRAYRPKLAVCLYHSPQDFREIPEYLDSLGLGYRFHLNQHYMNQWETVLYAEPGPQEVFVGQEVMSTGTDPRVNPGIANYFIGEQYRCQQICITEGFWTPQRIEAENDNGSRPVLEWALTMIDRGRELSILDIGCGPSQKMARMFGPHANIRITGLDSVEATDLARRFNPGGTYLPCDLDSDESITAASAQMGTFDVIFVLDVIEHVLHPEKMIGLIKAHSRPDTMIFLTTLERDISANAGPLTEGSRKPEHVREWNADEFRQFLQYMGLALHEFKLTPLHGNQWCQTFLCSLPDAATPRTSNGGMNDAERGSSVISTSGEQRIISPSRQELLALDAEHYAAERLRVAHVSYPPRWVTIGISSMCTNHCTFCSYHSLDARDISNVYGLKYAMPLPRFKSQVDFFHAGRVPNIHVCGTGEPFLHPDIMAMIDYVIERYGVTSFQSTFNRAVIARGDYLPKILERRAHISYITTDIHAGDAAGHEAIKRGSSFEELFATLQTLSNAGIWIHGHFILTRQNHASLPELVGILRERGIRLQLIVDNLFPHMFNEFTALENVYRVGDQDIAASLQMARELAEAAGSGIELLLPRPFGDPTARCSVFWDKIQIWPVKGVDPARYDENLIPHACNAVVRGDLNSLGYVSDYPDVMALWNNPTLVSLRTKILAGEAPDRFCWSCPCGVALKC